jgi:hypothetical protein
MQPVFLIFDCIAVENQPYVSMPLVSRLEGIKRFVGLYRDALTQGRLPKQHLFSLIGKTFYRKADVSTLLQRLNHKDRVYKDDRRHHQTDGLIFTPSGAYPIRTCTTLFKWKYTDMLSIDLSAEKRLVNNQWKTVFACVGEGNVRIEYALNLLAADEFRVSRLIDAALQQSDQQQQQQQSVRSPIIEVAFDPWRGYWHLKGVRKDKNRPNFVVLVTDTLETIAENLTIHELQFRLTLGKSEEEWRTQMEQAAKDFATKAAKQIAATSHPQQQQQQQQRQTSHHAQQQQPPRRSSQEQQH